jgi:precorrin-6B methylase 2
MGDSRGRWEGATLVVETVRFSDKTNFRGSDQNLRLVERLTRIDRDTIEYRFTVDDPTVWTRPWTAAFPLHRTTERLVEYACHEGNFRSIEGLLRAPRRPQMKIGLPFVPFVPFVSFVSFAFLTSQDVHFAMTPMPVVDAMLRLAQVTPRDVVYDLGSGDGRVVMLAAQKYGARGVGVEIDPRLVELSRQVARDGEVGDRVRFIQGDFFTTDISEATVVALWLSEGLNARLQPKLRRELRPGARIVSHQFHMRDWAPDRTLTVDGEDVFLWVVPQR